MTPRWRKSVGATLLILLRSRCSSRIEILASVSWEKIGNYSTSSILFHFDVGLILVNVNFPCVRESLRTLSLFLRVVFFSRNTCSFKNSLMLYSIIYGAAKNLNPFKNRGLRITCYGASRRGSWKLIRCCNGLCCSVPANESDLRRREMPWETERDGRRGWERC